MQIYVFVILKNDNQFLLVKESAPRWKDCWFLPGGKVMKDENINDTAVREVFRKTGYQIKSGGIVRLEVTGDGFLSQDLYCYINAEIISGRLKDYEDDYSGEARWLTADDIEGLNIHQDKLQEKLIQVDGAELPVSKLVLN